MGSVTRVLKERYRLLSETAARVDTEVMTRRYLSTRGGIRGKFISSVK